MKSEGASGASDKTRISSELTAMMRLQRLSTLSVTQGDLGIILCEIVDTAIEVTGADFGSIQFIDPVSSALRIAAHRGFPQWWVDFWNNAPEGQGSCPVSLQRRERVIVENVEESPIFSGAVLEMLLKADVRGVQSTPLVSRSGKLLGTFSTHYKKPQRPDEGQLRVLDLLARQAADIIEHLQDIAMLRESEERFRSMADGIPLIIWVTDAEGHMQFVNRAYMEYFGVTLEDVKSGGWQPLVHPDDVTAYAAEYMACLRDRRFFHAEVRAKRRDGEWRWMESSGQPRVSSTGQFLGIAGSSPDITERKLAEEALREREQRLRLALEASGGGCWVRDVRTGSVHWDDRFREIYGLTAGEPASFEAWLSHVHEEDRPQVLELWNQILHTKTHDSFDTRFRIVRSDGTVLWIQSLGQVHRDTEGQIMRLIGLELDVTAHRHAEEALRTVSVELQQTVRIAATGLNHCSRDLRFLSANPAYAQYVGVPLHQIIGRSIVEVIGKAAFDRVRPRIERVLCGETVEYEDELPYPGGNKWMRGAYTPERDASGNVIGWVASIMDITERKRMEEERAEEGRRKDEFLSLLGHELRNPLGAISNAVQLLSSGVTDEQRAFLDGMMNRQVKLMQRLLDDLLDLGRITHGYIQLKKERVELAKFLQHVSEVTQSTMVERGQELILRLPSEVVTFKADEARLEQIAINLLSNASKYTAQGGRIELSGAREGSEVVLRCKDNGRGIPRDMQQKIFEPFTRVEPFAESRGEASLGIGLALVKRLVELHGGTVAVESAGPGTGSEFSVRLPLEPAPSEQPDAPETKSSPTSLPSRSVVLVEDNSDVAGTLVVALEKAGYRVTLFADALSTLAGLSDLKPHAVLYDIGLPDMDGYKLAEKLRKERNLRDTLFIAISGFTKRPTAESADDFDHYLTKPVNISSLLNLLDSTPAQAGEARAATAGPVLQKPAIRALLIDDHVDLSAAMAELLNREGLEVQTALSGEEGLKLASDFHPQLILCDLHLPDMSGKEVIRRLRLNPDTRHAYSVILSALSEAEIRALNGEASKMGVDEFIPKPLRREITHSLVAKLLTKTH
jgi:PAS domain S-box-containing protein